MARVIGPKDVRSQKVEKLCSNLGFPEQDHVRFLMASIQHHYDLYKAQGCKVPAYTIDTPEARQCALNFCEDKNRGYKWWGACWQGNSSWSDVPNEIYLYIKLTLTRILYNVAHLFTWQAYNDCQSPNEAKKREREQGNISSNILANKHQVADVYECRDIQ